MCLFAVLCTGKLSTEVSKESKVFVSKQEKQMGSEKRKEVISPWKGERNRIGTRVLTNAHCILIHIELYLNYYFSYPSFTLALGWFILVKKNALLFLKVFHCDFDSHFKLVLHQCCVHVEFDINGAALITCL